MTRYTGEEMKQAWGQSPRAAKRQAEKAVPLIEKEISDLKCELEIAEYIAKRPIPEVSKPGPVGEELATARGDSDEAGGVGSQVKEEATA